MVPFVIGLLFMISSMNYSSKTPSYGVSKSDSIHTKQQDKTTTSSLLERFTDGTDGSPNVPEETLIRRLWKKSSHGKMNDHPVQEKTSSRLLHKLDARSSVKHSLRKLLDATSSMSFYWPQRSQVGADIDGEAAGDRSGYSVALSANGKVLAIGAPYNDGNGERSGHVRVFREDLSSVDGWIQIGSDIEGQASYSSSRWTSDLFGHAVALSDDGSVLAVGTARSSGYVRIFHFVGSVWVQVGMDIDYASYRLGGVAVALSGDGDIVAIGMPYNEDTSYKSGHVRVFKRNSSVALGWEQLGSALVGDTDYKSGWAIALSNDGFIVAIGSPLYDYVRVFKYNESSNSWSQPCDSIDIPSWFHGGGCYSVALSEDGTIVAVATNRSVLVFEFLNELYGCGYLLIEKIRNRDGSIYSTNSVSLSASGDILAVGASESGSGQVRVFRRDETGRYLQVGDDIHGEAEGDESGHAIALSKSGEVIAIGAPNNDGNRGHVRVYRTCEPKPPSPAPTKAPTSAPTPAPTSTPTSQPTSAPTCTPDSRNTSFWTGKVRNGPVKRRCKLLIIAKRRGKETILNKYCSIEDSFKYPNGDIFPPAKERCPSSCSFTC